MGFNMKSLGWLALATGIGAAVVAPIVSNFVPNEITNIGS